MKNKSFQSLLGLSITAALFLSLSSCAPMKKSPPSRTPPATKKPSVTTQTLRSGHNAAESNASDVLIEEGVQSLNAGDKAKAKDSFQQAVSLDPWSGEGFYYLALCDFEEGHLESASGLLEKAALIFKDEGNDDWSQKVSELKSKISPQ